MENATTPAQQDSTSGRFRHFVQHERESGVHPAIRALHARAKGDTSNTGRAVQYARIERGHTA